MKSPSLRLALAASACVLSSPFALAANSPVTNAPAAATSAASGWDAVPAILARIKAPQFPARDFAITDYGAKADGTTDNTEALRNAIAACHDAGGGRVLVQGGTFLTGAVHLKSNVNLHIAEGATLLFSPDPAKYPMVFTRWEGMECMNYSPLIYAWEQENIAITGKGTLDGSASQETWWSWNDKRNSPTKQVPARDKLHEMMAANVPVAQRVFGDGSYLRPNFIQPYKCKNILIEDVSIVRSPMWEINPVLSSNITVRGVKIVTHGTNNDGCNPESSRDVLIENCLFDTGDDCIAIKSGRDADGRRIGVPSENIIIRNCVMKEGHGGVVIGSESAGGVRNVFAEDCKMDSPELERALRLKTNAKRGGIVENIYFRNVEIGQVSHSVLTLDLVYEKVIDGPYTPTVRNVVMENVTVKKAPRVLSIVGTPKSIVENVRIVNSTFRGVEGPDELANSGTVTYQNVTVQAAPRARPNTGGAAGENAKSAKK